MFVSIYLSICLSVYLSIFDRSINRSIDLTIYLFFYLSTCLSICLSIYLSIYLFLCLSVCLSVWLFVYLSTCLSASLKTKLFCETSSFCELGNIKNEAILREFLQIWKVACSADGLVPLRFAIFPVHLSKLLRLPGKKCQVIRSAAPVTQNHLSKPEDLRLQNATPFQEISAWTS